MRSRVSVDWSAWSATQTRCGGGNGGSARVRERARASRHAPRRSRGRLPRRLLRARLLLLPAGRLLQRGGLARLRLRASLLLLLALPASQARCEAVAVLLRRRWCWRCSWWRRGESTRRAARPQTCLQVALRERRRAGDGAQWHAKWFNGSRQRALACSGTHLGPLVTPVPLQAPRLLLLRAPPLLLLLRAPSLGDAPLDERVVVGGSPGGGRRTREDRALPIGGAVARMRPRSENACADACRLSAGQREPRACAPSGCR